MMTSYLYYKEKLTGDYLKAFDRAETYAMGIGMEEVKSNDMLMELLDILYTAQQEKKPVEAVLGDDEEQFCREFFEGYHTWSNFLYSVPKWMYRMSWFVFVVTLLDLLAMDHPLNDFFTATTDISYIGAGVIVGVLSTALASLLGRFLLFRWKRMNNKIYLAGVVIGSFVLIAASVVCVGDSAVSVPLYMVLLAALIDILLYKILQFAERYQKYGSIRRPQEEKDLGAWRMFRQGMESEWEKNPMSEQMLFFYEKKFLKKNKRRMKRKQPLMTEEEYTGKIRRENKKISHHVLFMPVMYTAIAAVPLVGELMGGTTWYDFLTFALILFLLEGGLCWFFVKADRMGCREREVILKECDERGVTLPELARLKRLEDNL